MTNPLNSVNLPQFPAVPKPAASVSSPGHASAPSSEAAVNHRDCSFEIVSSAASAKAAGTVQAFPVLPKTAQLPLALRKKRSTISSHRHDANPALAIKVLSDIHAAVEGWHQALRQTLLEIQAIYMEGPIVEGWLEMVHPPEPNQSISSAVLRHADPQELTGYVDRLCQEATAAATGEEARTGAAAGSAVEPQYRLCSLDADGQLQCQLCPPDQIPFVSMAVARHQKLRQHLNQKQYLEARLKRAVDALTQVREDLGIAASFGTQPEP